MPIITVADNENNRWNRNAEKKEATAITTTKNKDRKEQGGTEAILKGWELNNFVAHLS